MIIRNNIKLLFFYLFSLFITIIAPCSKVLIILTSDNLTAAVETCIFICLDKKPK